jgi:hypothetical protein
MACYLASDFCDFPYSQGDAAKVFRAMRLDVDEMIQSRDAGSLENARCREDGLWL